MKRLVLAAAALAASTLAGVPARAADAPTDRPCLQIGQVYDFKPVPGNRSLIVIDRFRKKYKVSFMGICPDLQLNLGLAFKSFGAGRLSCLERGDQVIARDPAMPLNRCPINKIEYYTPAMEQADAAAAAAAKSK